MEDPIRLEFYDPADIKVGNDLGELGEVSPGVPEPLDVPGAEDQVGGLAGLDVDGLGPGRSDPEEESEDRWTEPKQAATYRGDHGLRRVE